MDIAPKYVALDGSSPQKIMIPLRFVSEGLGYEVDYDSSTRTVGLSKSKSKDNATNVVFTTSEDVDTFLIYGETSSPEIQEIIVVEDSIVYIDILKPNTILDDVENNFINEDIDSLSVSNYKIYELSDKVTRLEVTTDMAFVNNVVQNSNVTKVYFKPTESVVDESSKEENTDEVVESVTDDVSVSLKSDVKGFDVNEIVHIDNYMEYSYELDFPVSLEEYIPTQNIIVNNEILESIEVLEVEGITKILFNGENVLHLEVREDSNYIVIDVSYARDAYDKIVVIDPGHGGLAPGTTRVVNGITYLEKDLVLDMGLKTAEFISKGSNFKVYETRTTDVTVDTYARPELSTKIEADLFISIHVNSMESSIPNGIETHYYDILLQEQNDPEYMVEKGIFVTDARIENSSRSKEFAEFVQANLISATKLREAKRMERRQSSENRTRQM